MGLRKGRREYDDEAHVPIDCPELFPKRGGILFDLGRFFLQRHVGLGGNYREQDPVGDGPARLMPMLKAILYAVPGRVDVCNAYKIGRFLIQAWRIRAKDS